MSGKDFEKLDRVGARNSDVSDLDNGSLSVLERENRVILKEQNRVLGRR